MKELSNRELDAWIATTLFGWVKTDVKCHPTDNRTIGGALYSPNGFKNDCNQASAVPQFTYDGAAAMMVFEKCLSSDSLTMPIEIDRKRHKAGRFRLESGPMSKGLLAIGDTLPLAICLFAKQLFSK